MLPCLVFLSMSWMIKVMYISALSTKTKEIHKVTEEPTYMSPLHKRCGHHDNGHLLLPHHSPEIRHSVVGGTLSGNVLPLPLTIALSRELRLKTQLITGYPCNCSLFPFMYTLEPCKGCPYIAGVFIMPIVYVCKFYVRVMKTYSDIVCVDVCRARHSCI